MNKDWKITEQIVKFIEQSIDPESRIEHDVNLPDMNSRCGLKRQCDLVIRTGIFPRETITIVEVQDRKSKVEIGTFDGWVQKMRDVGASHLICVSKKGYPQSVIDKAYRLGPTIRLVKYKELEDGYWPLDFLESYLITERRTIVAIKDTKLDFISDIKIDKHNLVLGIDDKCFVLENKEYSGFELVYMYLDYYRNSIAEYSEGKNVVNIIFPFEEVQELFYKRDNKTYKILSLKLTVEFIFDNIRNFFTSFKYEQIDYNSELAWVFQANTNINRKDRIVNVVFIPLKNGNYRIENEIKSTED